MAENCETSGASKDLIRRTLSPLKQLGAPYIDHGNGVITCCRCQSQYRKAHAFDCTADAILF